MHHFTNAGLYDALFVMQDTETKTLWNHITGEALYGDLVGRTLGPVANVLQTNVAQALARDPAARVAISDRMYFAGGKPFGTATGFGGRGPAVCPARRRDARAAPRPPVAARLQRPGPEGQDGAVRGQVAGADEASVRTPL